MQCMIALFKKNKNFQQIKLTDVLTAPDLPPLFDALKNSRQLRELSYGGYHPGFIDNLDSGLYQALARNLNTWGFTTLRLTYTITEEEFNLIAKQLATNTTITELHMYHTTDRDYHRMHTGLNSLIYLAQQLKNNHTLKILDIEDYTVKSVPDLLFQNNSLLSITISGSERENNLLIGDLPSLATNETLLKLHFSKAVLFYPNLFDYIAQNQTLQILELSNMRINNIVAVGTSFINMMRVNKYLITLSIPHNPLFQTDDPIFFAKFLNALTVASLQNLNLGPCPLFLKYINDGFNRNQLKVLDLQDIVLVPREFAKLAEILKSNDKLIQLNIHNDGDLPVNVKKSLIDMLQSNYTLQKILYKNMNDYSSDDLDKQIRERLKINYHNYRVNKRTLIDILKQYDVRNDMFTGDVRKSFMRYSHIHYYKFPDKI